MTTAPYILARTFAEAHAFAMDDLGLGKGHYRVVNSSGTLKAVRGVDLYLVPGWRQRFDRFAMQSALRWTRMTVIDIAELRAQESERFSFDDLPTVTADERWSDTAYTRTIAERYDRLRELLGDEPLVKDGHDAPVTLEKQVSAQEPAPEAVRRRRRRCDECGILVDPDDVETHNADHLAGAV